MAANTQLGGTIQLPDGRSIPVVVSLDLSQVEPPVALSESLLLRAVEVFGKTEKASSWLNSRLNELGGRTPLEVAATTDGRARVLGILHDLEFGFPA